jgi:hypothetical protein
MSVFLKGDFVISNISNDDTTLQEIGKGKGELCFEGVVISAKKYKPGYTRRDWMINAFTVKKVTVDDVILSLDILEKKLESHGKK